MRVAAWGGRHSQVRALRGLEGLVRPEAQALIGSTMADRERVLAVIQSRPVEAPPAARVAAVHRPAGSWGARTAERARWPEPPAKPRRAFCPRTRRRPARLDAGPTAPRPGSRPAGRTASEPTREEPGARTRGRNRARCAPRVAPANAVLPGAPQLGRPCAGRDCAFCCGACARNTRSTISTGANYSSAAIFRPGRRYRYRESSCQSSLETDESPDVGRCRSGRSQRCERGVLRAFRQFAASRIEDETVMAVNGLGIVQQDLQQPLHIGGGK